MTVLEKDVADYLLKLPKHYIGEVAINFPSVGGRIEYDLFSKDKRERFIMMVNQKKVVLYYTFQARARNCYVLARLDYGAPHLNPDGKRIGAPHLHLYTEEYGDRYAVELPKEDFSNIGNPIQTYEDFLKFCNVVVPPPINYGLVFNPAQ